ncbi:MAG: adenylosuccinate lyase [Vampirovibrionales bacterium]|nr:adenylosuccinate lyase [Vampirovibrionales bacterium]
MMLANVVFTTELLQTAMIPRYSTPDMTTLWAPQAKTRLWLQVELAVTHAQEALGLVPAGTHNALQQALANVFTCDEAATVLLERADAIELETRHDIIAFLTAVGEVVTANGSDAHRHLHLGMTSSDLIDTALSLQLQQSGALIVAALTDAREAVYQRALEFKNTPCIGRSHGIHGEPITFGLKLLTWVDELDRGLERLKSALEECRVGQISGAMGTYATNDPAIETAVCHSLGLKPSPTSTQVISRDIHAQFTWALASLGASLEKFSVELRHLQRTEVLEVEEGFAKGQKGSSAMPHKRNPISGENLTGLARLLRSYVTPALENVALWHERDISHSSVERVTLPDACQLAHYSLKRFTTLVANLQIFPENMARNLTLYGGVIFSQRVLLALIEAGSTREAAYTLVQRNAHLAWNRPSGDFKANLLKDSDVTHLLSPDALEACFNVAPYLAHVDTMFARFSSLKGA